MRRSRILVVAFLFLLCAGWLTVTLHARLPQPTAEYQARRAKVRGMLHAPVVLFGYTGHEESGPVDRFFQENNFYYLTGHNEPGAALLIIPEPPDGKKLDGPQEILYLPKRNPFTERWEGPRLGPGDPGVAEKTGFSDVESFEALKPELQKLAETIPEFYTLIPLPHEDGYPFEQQWNEWLKEAAPKPKLLDLRPTLGAMRQMKSAGELALLQRAVDLSVDAQFDAIRRMHPGLYEYQIAARMEFIHLWGGCDREAYSPIVGAGFNSTVLHYAGLLNRIQDGDVVVMDVAGEYGGYAADVTRTVPANGKFTPRQREIYDVVYGAQNAALAALKPGMTFSRTLPNSLSKIAFDYINTHGKDKEDNPLGRYFIHGLGHHIGLDVHDAGDPYAPLQAGMVVTIEPGVYIPEEKIGVRIEDDVLITPEGYKLLTERLPRSADEIQKIMAEAKKHPPAPLP
jgi:Xaa-Pro aminopeptidase